MAEIETKSMSEMEAVELHLEKAIDDNKPWIAIAILKLHPALCTRGLGAFGERVLMKAILRGCSTEYIARIIEMTPDEVLSKQDGIFGKTVLHVVAEGGKIELAKLLLEKCPNLLLIRQSGSGDLPIHTAVRNGHRDMKDYFLKVSKEQKHDDPFEGVNDEDLLRSAMAAEMNDVIIALSYNNPDLVFKWINDIEEAQRRHNEQTVLEAMLSRLLKAINNGDQPSVNIILNEHPDLTTTSLTSFGETPIMLAAAAAAKKVGSSDKFDLIKMLIGRMLVEELAMRDFFGDTVLHKVAMVGNTQVAKMMLTKCPDLLCIQNCNGDTPICVSVKRGHKDVTKYLFDKAREEGHDDPFIGSARVDVLRSAIKIGMYETLQMEDGSVLEDLAADPSALLIEETVTPLSCWKAALVRTKRSIFGIDSSPDNLRLWIIKIICHRVSSMNYEKASSILKEPFLLAARNGVEDIVRLILSCHPDAINFVDEDNHSIFHLAVMYRCENIFKFVYQYDVSRRLLSMPDKNRNNVLHLVGYPAHQNKLDQSTRVILQMQRELKWFKELHNLLSPQDVNLKNYLGKTPLTVFNEEHKDLVAKEIQWMSGMASACSVAAPLIATVAFAAAITVPGGNTSNGLPVFSNHNTFVVFTVSDALALFASITCVLSLLSIFTSRYGVNDFLYALPNRLIIGLVSLFIAALSLMIAFGTTLLLVFGQKDSLILIPIIAFCCAPIIIYAILQLPSLLNIIKSTYGRKLLIED